MTKVETRGGENKEMKIDLEIKPEAYQKMMALTRACPSEVGGLIVCDINLPKIIVEDILVPEQEATGADWVADAGKMADLLTPFIDKQPEIWTKTKGWWHSHGRIGCHWSPTDDGNIDDLLPVSKILVSIVTNKSMDMKVRVDMVLPNGMFLSIDDIDPKISMFSKKVENWTEEQLKKVTAKKHVWHKSWGKKVEIDDDQVFWGYDNRQHISDSGLHHPQFGFIPGRFNDLSVENQQAFLKILKESRKKNAIYLNNKQKNKMLKEMIAKQDEEDKKDKEVSKRESSRSNDYYVEDSIDHDQIPFGGG